MNRKNIAFSLSVLVILTFLVACNVSSPQASSPQTELSLDTLPDDKGFAAMSTELQQEIYSFLYSTPYDELENYIEEAFRKSAEGQSEFSFHTIDILQDPMLVENKNRVYNNLFITVEFSAKFDRDMPFSKMETMTEQWYQDFVSKASRHDIAVVYMLKEIKIRFKDQETNRYIDMDLTPHFTYKNEEDRPKIPGQTKEEIQTIVLVSDYLEALSAEEHKFTLKRFGINAVGSDSNDELYAEINVAYPGTELSLQEIADNLLAELKNSEDAQSYIKSNDLSFLTVVINTPTGANKYETFQYSFNK